MQPEVLKQLGVLTNNPKAFYALEKYLNARIEDNKRYLTQAETMDDVRKYQGAIFELTNMLGLRERVEQEKKNG